MQISTVLAMTTLTHHSNRPIPSVSVRDKSENCKNVRDRPLVTMGNIQEVTTQVTNLLPSTTTPPFKLGVHNTQSKLASQTATKQSVLTAYGNVPSPYLTVPSLTAYGHHFPQMRVVKNMPSTGRVVGFPTFL